MNKYGIIVIGFNRIDSIQRLVGSLLKADYDEKVDLIFSIDNSGIDTVEKYASKIEWKYGEKIIRTFEKRMGLRNHILKCGNYMNEYGYDAVIILEDDLFVSPGFFLYAKQCVERYKDDDKIAGISLYTHIWNVNADRPFQAIHKGYDVFFMQYPQSWGQVWMRKQWNAFYEWYSSKQYEEIEASKIPDNVLGWPESSWLKFHVEYCISQNKYFVYPFYSLTTNFADAGTHYAFNTNKMQVPLSLGQQRRSYCFPLQMQQSSVYDAFFENEGLKESLHLGNDTRLLVDLYGKKKWKENDTDYLLSTQRLHYKVLRSFGLEMRPWDTNVLQSIPGKVIFLYDVAQNAEAPRIKHKSVLHWTYDTHGEVMLKHNAFAIASNELKNKLRDEVFKLKKKVHKK